MLDYIILKTKDMMTQTVQILLPFFALKSVSNPHK